VDATIVIVNNGGGGIFHMLPIEEFDPPFTDYFKTPHNVEFAPLSAAYGIEFTTVETLSAFERAFSQSVGSGESQIIEVRVDAEASHRTRERLHERVCERVGGSPAE
jgi:2-succinyl-5-enolpyruvyl-6-hydroxy-3-cyclohexene-1-carboxylate synthase